MAKIGQNFVCFISWALLGSPVRVALFDVTISNCCSKGIIGGIISFRDKQCIMNYNQNNSFVDNTLALGAQKNVKQLINAAYGKGDLISRGDLSDISQSKGLIYIYQNDLFWQDNFRAIIFWAYNRLPHL